jgi:uncharacterized protein (TIGR02145 family)
LVSIAIGGGNKDASSNAFTSLDWSKGPYFIKIETDPTGGSSYSLSSVSQLLSVPYALNSGNGYSRVSKNGDTLYFDNNKFVIIPGISKANLKTSGYGEDIFDIENNKYKTVYIGNQQWMAENLKTSKYSDGTMILNITDDTQWQNNTTGAWANYNNSDSLGEKYGKLYNWYAVSPTTNGNKNVCPTGWHVPTDAEWTVLTDYLGGESIAGGKMKEVGTTNWNSPNTDATNITLFTGLPCGLRYGSGGFYSGIGNSGYWMSSTEKDAYYAWIRELNSANSIVNRSVGMKGKKSGFSVRCLKD